MLRRLGGLILVATLASCHWLLPLAPGDGSVSREGLAGDRARDRPVEGHLDGPRADERRYLEARPADRTGDAGPPGDGLDPLIPAPRLVAPLSGSSAHGADVVFAWAVTTGSPGAHVEILDGPAGSIVYTLKQPVGTSLTCGKASLGTGKVWWRLRGRNGAAVGTSRSVVWELWLPPGGAAGKSSAWGQTPDLSIDGFADLVVGRAPAGGVYLYLGSNGGLSTAAGPYYSSGYTLAVLDFNGDGQLEVCHGDPLAANVAIAQAGAVYCETASGVPPLRGLQTSGAFGSVAALGDFDGDGYADLAVGEPGWNAGGGNLGRVSIYQGAPTGFANAPWTVVSETPAKLGGAVAAAGDVNGDGFADLLIGTQSGANHVLICYGGHTFSQAANCTKITGIASEGFGKVVAGAGDLDGDGYADVLIGAPDWSSGIGTGLFYRCYGGPAGLTNPASTTGSTRTEFGRAVASAGDVNGDGLSDVIVGSSGGMLVFLSTARTFGQSFGASDPEPSFGLAVAGIGDVNGDGLAEVAVGVPNAATPRVDVYTWNKSTAKLELMTSRPLASAGFGATLATVY